MAGEQGENLPAATAVAPTIAEETSPSLSIENNETATVAIPLATTSAPESGDNEGRAAAIVPPATTTAPLVAPESGNNETVAAEASPATTTAPLVAPESGDNLKTAYNALVQGKRHLLVKDIASSLSALGEACRLFVELKGTFCSESGDSHFYYGKALLEQARSELSVFEGPSGGGDDEDDEEDDDEEEEDEEGGEDEDEEMKDVETETAADEESKEETPMEATSEVVDLNVPSPVEAIAKPTTNGTAESASASSSVPVVDNEQPSTSAGINDSTVTEKEDDEPSNLELAWEVLEIAKVAFVQQIQEVTESIATTRSLTTLDESTRKTETDDLMKILKGLRRRLADTHVLLGEVATESEQYLRAEEDFRTALAVLGDIEEPDSRQIAQCYFQLGLAYAFDKKFVEGIECFRKSAALISLRISNLQTLIDTKQTAKDRGIELEDTSYSEEQEIKDLQSILPEMEEKITDTIDAQKESLKTIEEEKEEQEIMERNSPIKNPNPPAANDISHLVKKKKKLDLDGGTNGAPSADEPPMKKQCLEKTNGVGVTVEITATNGTAPAAEK